MHIRSAHYPLYQKLCKENGLEEHHHALPRDLWKVKVEEEAAAKAKGSRAAHKFRQNSDNPVVIGNLVVSAVVATALGVGIYKKYTAGEFSWKVGGIFAGVVGLFGVADYYVSQ